MRLLVPLCAALLPGAWAMRADAADAARYRLHFTAITCRTGPCPEWDVTDRVTGAHFGASVRFATPGTAVPRAVAAGTQDLLADGERAEMKLGAEGPTRIIFTVTRLEGTVAAGK